jgi:hypothetical protein
MIDRRSALAGLLGAALAPWRLLFRVVLGARRPHRRPSVRDARRLLACRRNRPGWYGLSPVATSILTTVAGFCGS